MKIRISVIIVCLLMLSCAELEIRKSRGPNDEGLPYYRPMPYLLISMSDNGFCKSEIIVLPDRSEEYRIIARPGMGSIEFGPTLDKGWNLTAFNSKVDTQTDENIEAVTGLISTLASLGVAGKSSEEGTIGPGLYQFVYDDKDKYITEIRQIASLTDSKGKPLTCPVAAPASSNTKPPKTH